MAQRVYLPPEGVRLLPVGPALFLVLHGPCELLQLVLQDVGVIVAQVLLRLLD